jgi:hypothetical protein
MDEIVLVGSEKDLVTRFGKPNDTVAPYFFNASSFLKYGNALKVVRYSGGSGDSTVSNAVGGSGSPSGALIKNLDDYNTKEISQGVHGDFIARCPGKAGNDLKVTVITEGSYTDAESGLGSTLGKALFDRAPEDGSIHIVVQDAGGSFADGASAETEVTLETFENVSLSATAKAETGGSNYYIDVLNRDSAFVFGGHPFTDAEANDTIVNDIEITFAEGEDYISITQSDIVADYQEFFGDTESVDVNFFVGGALSSSDANTVITAAATRKDVVAFVSPPVADVTNKTNTQTAVNAAVTWANAINSSSYGVLDSASVYVYDKYNDKNRFIGAAGLVAGLNAYTDDVADPWFSPAGFNRGQLRSVIKLAYNPTNIQRDSLYKARINPLVSFPGQGTVLFGDKTALSKPSAFDRINVRRLFITIEKAIATAAKFQLFEFNDEFTRAMFRNMTEPFLREVQGRRGITDFAVICDETNNTGNIIDTNQFVADIYVKPARSINFITLNFIATRTGIEFSEVIGK